MPGLDLPGVGLPSRSRLRATGLRPVAALSPSSIAAAFRGSRRGRCRAPRVAVVVVTDGVATARAPDDRRVCAAAAPHARGPRVRRDRIERARTRRLERGRSRTGSRRPPTTGPEPEAGRHSHAAPDAPPAAAAARARPPAGCRRRRESRRQQQPRRPQRRKRGRSRFSGGALDAAPYPSLPAAPGRRLQRAPQAEARPSVLLVGFATLIGFFVSPPLASGGGSGTRGFRARAAGSVQRSIALAESCPSTSRRPCHGRSRARRQLEGRQDETSVLRAGHGCAPPALRRSGDSHGGAT